MHIATILFERENAFYVYFDVCEDIFSQNEKT
jgi:hypothetical protein